MIEYKLSKRHIFRTDILAVRLLLFINPYLIGLSILLKPPFDPCFLSHGPCRNTPVKLIQTVAADQLIHGLQPGQALPCRSQTAGIAIQTAADPRTEALQIFHGQLS